ncbi:CIA30 family protein [Algoriphagus sediminis]|uniref:CIA30 family protein n=1 Tax=Algoriphagus sediminis TaxID=3057113 RepID=A0ABT7YC94_9BACT|nr:CIA30 family protein [Algoriphagus sediminis]MDN3204155.1 CIA30 family protein [Algoriphagus sediminis]
MLVPLILIDFSNLSNPDNWRVVDDGVMGGLSQGNFELTEEGSAVFYGTVRLENNGGFSSLRHRFDERVAVEGEFVKLYLKGDGKKYQFRIKRSSQDYYSYIYEFQTSGEWEEILVPLGEMYPAFRGRKLRMDNYPADILEEIAFLIGNKKKESFRLELSRIEII